MVTDYLSCLITQPQVFDCTSKQIFQGFSCEIAGDVLWGQVVRDRVLSSGTAVWDKIVSLFFVFFFCHSLFNLDPCKHLFRQPKYMIRITRPDQDKIRNPNLRRIKIRKKNRIIYHICQTIN